MSDLDDLPFLWTVRAVGEITVTVHGYNLTYNVPVLVGSLSYSHHLSVCICDKTKLPIQLYL